MNRASPPKLDPSAPEDIFVEPTRQWPVRVGAGYWNVSFQLLPTKPLATVAGTAGASDADAASLAHPKDIVTALHRCSPGFLIPGLESSNDAGVAAAADIIAAPLLQRECELKCAPTPEPTYDDQVRTVREVLTEVFATEGGNDSTAVLVVPSSIARSAVAAHVIELYRQKLNPDQL